MPHGRSWSVSLLVQVILFAIENFTKGYLSISWHSADNFDIHNTFKDFLAFKNFEYIFTEWATFFPDEW